MQQRTPTPTEDVAAAPPLVEAGNRLSRGTVTPMTVLSRGARNRRGGRGPGWPLLTGLLVLAILASSTLVFTDRVELLRLAVVLSLWAAVMAAFVTVIYRRQSELDQARARDMKFVYDLQLDREISARREYELSVEARLRRQLQAQSGDEMAALRSELASLRSQLAALVGADFGDRPALEGDRGAVPMPAAPGRVESSRVTSITEDVVAIVAAAETEVVLESPIIDVPEEPLTAAEPPPVEPRRPAPEYRGSHRRPSAEPTVPSGVPAGPATAPPRPRPAPVSVPRSTVQAPPAPAPPSPPGQVPAPRRPAEAPWRPPEVRRGRHATGEAGRTPRRREPVVPPAAQEGPRGRHRGAPDDPAGPPGRHRDPQVQEAQESVAGPAGEPQGQHAGGQPVADLMARLQARGRTGGGGRRRRED